MVETKISRNILKYEELSLMKQTQIQTRVSFMWYLKRE